MVQLPGSTRVSVFKSFPTSQLAQFNQFSIRWLFVISSACASDSGGGGSKREKAAAAASPTFTHLRVQLLLLLLLFHLLLPLRYIGLHIAAAAAAVVVVISPVATITVYRPTHCYSNSWRWQSAWKMRPTFFSVHIFLSYFRITIQPCDHEMLSKVQIKFVYSSI